MGLVDWTSHGPTALSNSNAMVIYLAASNYLKHYGINQTFVVDACSNSTKILNCATSSFLATEDMLNANYPAFAAKTNPARNYPYADTNGITYDAILSYIKGNISALTETFTIKDINMALINAVNSGDDSRLANSLELDLLSSGFTATQMRSNILDNLSGSDAASIATSLYNILNWPYLANIEGPIQLSLAIDDYIQNNNVDAAIIAANITNSIASLTGDFTYNDIARTILAAFNNNDPLLADLLKLDIDALAIDGDNQYLYPNSSSLTPVQVQQLLININGTDGASMTQQIYSDLNYTWASSIPGLLYLSNHILFDSGYHNISYPQIILNIKGNVSALSGNFSNNDLTLSITTSLGEQDNIAFALLLETDMDSAYNTTSLSPAAIQNAIVLYTTGNDAPSIASSIYATFKWGAGILGIEGLDILINIIYHDIKNGATDVAATMSSAINHLSGNFTFNDIAIVMAKSLNVSNGSPLTQSLQLDFNVLGQLGYSPVAVQQLLSNITGDDAPSIATNIYASLYWLGISNDQAFTAFTRDLSMYEQSDNVAIYDIVLPALENAVGPIFLRANLSNFNICFQEGELFYVDTPVIQNYNNNTYNIFQILEQCALLADLQGQSHYISLTHNIGTIGNANDTGCILVNDASIIDLCYSETDPLGIGNNSGGQGIALGGPPSYPN